MELHLTHVLEYELWDQYDSYLIQSMKLRNISEPYDPLPNAKNPNSPNMYKDRSRYHKEFYEGKNRIIRYNRLFTNLIYDWLGKRGLPTIDETKVLSFWVASYAYEFFFIQMPRYELLKTLLPKNSNTNEDIMKTLDNTVPEFQNIPMLHNSADIEKSFSMLKKGFSLLFLPYAFAIINEDLGDNVFGSLKTTAMSSTLWLRQLLSEGYHPMYKTMFHIWSIEDKKKSVISLSQDFEDQFPILNTFFVILFADLAEQMLIDGNYNFRKNMHIPNEKKNSLLQFVLCDFMPVVIQKIKLFLNNDESSGRGLQLYLRIANMIDHLPASEHDNKYTQEQQSVFKNLDTTFTLYSDGWMKWFHQKAQSAIKYKEWLSYQGSEEYFDIMKNAKTVDDLLNNTFDDHRKNRI